MHKIIVDREEEKERIQEDFYKLINSGIKFKHFFLGLTDTNRQLFLKYHLEQSTLTILMTNFSDCIPLIRFMPKIQGSENSPKFSK